MRASGRLRPGWGRTVLLSTPTIRTDLIATAAVTTRPPGSQRSLGDVAATSAVYKLPYYGKS